jgi:hypothetical protein
MKKFSVVLCLGLVAMIVPVASASHPTQMCLDIDPDQAFPMSNDDSIDRLWAYPGATDADHPPQHEGCVTERTEPDQDWGGTNIDFEITGVADPDESDSPSSPDMTCTVSQGSGKCSVTPPVSAGGEQTIRGWIDIDLDNETVELDAGEGRDEEKEPGDQPEPDMTDVATWMWTHGDPPPAPCGNDDVCWSRITIDYQPPDHQFLGQIRREDGSCGAGTVTLWKRRSGPDRRVAEAASSDRSWELVLDHAVTGRFYAKLSKTQTAVYYGNGPRYECEKDRSPTIRV